MPAYAVKIPHPPEFRHITISTVSDFMKNMLLSRSGEGEVFPWRQDPVRVAFIEDAAETRKYLEILLTSEPSLEFLQGFETLESALPALRELAPQVILLDIKPLGKAGMEGIGLIRKILPQTQIIMFTVSTDASDVFRALQAGADGYVLKRFTREELVYSILVAHLGGSPISPAVARKVLPFFRNTAPKPQTSQNLKMLSRRQQQVLELLAKGKSLKVIAAELEVSLLTVRWHIRTAYKVLNVHSQSQAVLKYVKARRSTGYD